MEIQFRLWNSAGVKSKMFYDQNEVMECLKQQIVFNNGNEKSGYSHVGDGSVFMKFTGLKDKKGKKIWEADIVKLHIPHETKTSHRSVVGFDYDGAFVNSHPAHIKMQLSQNRKLSDYCGRYSDDCEVIGNIYENPELLNPPVK